MIFTRSIRFDRVLLAGVLGASCALTTAGANAAPPPPAPPAVLPQTPTQPQAQQPQSQMPASQMPPQSQPQSQTLLQSPSQAQALPVGSTITTQLTSADVNTKNARPGDPVTMQVVTPYPDANIVFAGATVRGHVANVRAAGQGRKAMLLLAFDSITFANGRNEPITGSVLAMDSKSENTTARKALGAGTGAAVGSQTVGRIIGGSAGSVVGLLGGAVAGFAFGANNKPNVNLATGSHVKIQTTSTVEVPLRQAAQ